VEDPGFPRPDPEEARRLVGQYEQRTGQQVSVVLSTTTDQTVLSIAELVQGDFEEVGIDTTLKPVDEATIINDAVGGNFEASLWTNSHAAGDPDEQYVWWHSESPVNFGRIDDPAIDQALAEGRSEPDPDRRRQIYESIPRAFAENVWNVWSTYTTETVTLGESVHGLLPPELPNGDKPYYLTATGFPKHALWKE
jgi:peptide/nickel transport system substrate-binding protein